MTMKTAGMTICAALAMVSVGWTQQTAPKKFHSNAGHPHNSLKSLGEGRAHSAPANALTPKTQAERQSEIARLERQNTALLQAQSQQSKRTHMQQAPRTKPETGTRSSSINFSYHPPRTQTQATSGGNKH